MQQSSAMRGGGGEPVIRSARTLCLALAAQWQRPRVPLPHTSDEMKRLSVGGSTVPPSELRNHSNPKAREASFEEQGRWRCLQHTLSRDNLSMGGRATA